MHADLLQSVQSGYHSNVASPAMLGATGPTILNKIPGIPCFLGTEREKDIVWFELWYHAISDAWKNFNEQLVRAAITKSCVLQNWPRKSEKVQTFVFHLERALKAIKQQHPYAMTEEEGHRHLKNHLFHGLKPNLHNAFCYLYDKPNSQYSQLVMASRKAETETLESSVSEVRAKSAVVGADTDSPAKVASFEPSYEAIMQQIAY